MLSKGALRNKNDVNRPTDFLKSLSEKTQRPRSPSAVSVRMQSCPRLSQAQSSPSVLS